MANTNLDIINAFFEAYAKGDRNGLEQTLAKDVKWIFPGRNPLSGTKNGIDELIAFFNAMGSIMGKSNPKVEKLIMSENKDYVIECQHIMTNRSDGVNLDHHWCVLWKFENGRIVEGRHFSSEQQDADEFFNTLNLL